LQLQKDVDEAKATMEHLAQEFVKDHCKPVPKESDFANELSILRAQILELQLKLAPDSQHKQRFKADLGSNFAESSIATQRSTNALQAVLEDQTDTVERPIPGELDGLHRLAADAIRLVEEQGRKFSEEMSRCDEEIKTVSKRLSVDISTLAIDIKAQLNKLNGDVPVLEARLQGLGCQVDACTAGNFEERVKALETASWMAATTRSSPAIAHRDVIASAAGVVAGRIRTLSGSPGAAKGREVKPAESPSSASAVSAVTDLGKPVLSPSALPRKQRDQESRSQSPRHLDAASHNHAPGVARTVMSAPSSCPPWSSPPQGFSDGHSSPIVPLSQRLGPRRSSETACPHEGQLMVGRQLSARLPAGGFARGTGMVPCGMRAASPGTPLPWTTVSTSAGTPRIQFGSMAAPVAPNRSAPSSMQMGSLRAGHKHGGAPAQACPLQGPSPEVHRPQFTAPVPLAPAHERRPAKTGRTVS
jgi:hypothetical protein